MVKIYTETTCDLSLEVLRELEVGVIPMRFTLDGTEYLDRFEMNPGEFFSLLEKTSSFPSTSQVTPQTYHERMLEVKKAGEEALFAVFSSKLSGSYQSAVVAAQEIDYPGIKVIDTKAASAGQGLIVHELANLAREGLTLAQLEEKALWMSEHIQHLVIVETLEMLKKGGRVSGTAAFMGGMMNVKPILHMEDGNLKPMGKTKGRKKAIQKVVAEIGKRCKNPENQKFFIAHGADHEGANQLNEAIKQQYGVEAFLITELGPVIGSHTGAGVLTVYFFDQ